MVSKEYAIAYVEVLEVLKRLNKNEYNRIPLERIKLYEDNKDKDYKFNLDITRDYDEQVSKTARNYYF